MQQQQNYKKLIKDIKKMPANTTTTKTVTKVFTNEYNVLPSYTMLFAILNCIGIIKTGEIYHAWTWIIPILLFDMVLFGIKELIKDFTHT